jgi:TonB family protein
LDTSYSGLKAVISSASALAEPDQTATVVRELEPGTVLEVVGTTGSGYAEISLKTGAIVYVSLGALGEREAAEDRRVGTEAALSAEAAVPELPQGSAAAPTQSLASLLSYADYPDAAVREGAEGRTGFTLNVDARGRVTNCTIEQSSGSTLLDEVTCRLMMTRARFLPARDVAGSAIADTYSSTINWVLP